VAEAPIAVVEADFNRDGFVDLVVIAFRSGDVTMLMGNGDGTFADGVACDVDARPRSLAKDDLDRYGWPRPGRGGNSRCHADARSGRPGVLSDPRRQEDECSVGLTREIQRRE
jgi:hypothetical protein